MKIAIDIRMTGSGGIGSYLNALLPFFIKNHSCVLIGSKENLLPFENENIIKAECETEPFSLKELFNFPKKVLKLINSCDVYYTPYINIPNGIKIPVFSTIHDVVFLDVKGLASKSGTFIRKLFYKRAIKKSKAIFTVSEFSKSRILHHLKCRKKIICTYNAVPAWFYESNNENIKKENTILFVGNIKKHKGLSVLLDSYLKAKNEGFSEKLIIVGNKDNFRTKDNSIFEKISGENEDSIIFTGKISDEELKKLYKSTKLLIQPSFYEGFGMPPLEAMSLNTHVVLSDIPVFKEIYEKFPVTFFKCGDSQDLKQKLFEAIKKSEENLVIPDIYSFEKTYKIISNCLEEK